MTKQTFIFLIFTLLTQFLSGQEIALLKYNGGGDWYANPTSLPNLIKFCNQNIQTKINEKPAIVSPGSLDVMSYPFVHMTGHGNVIFSDQEIINLRNYLYSGGFLHIDDNYGMDEYARREIKKIFPDLNLVEIPAQHPIFQMPFSFPKGMPKIHEHDNKSPKTLGIFIKNRLVLLYTHETDLGDGWEDEEVHNNPKEVRRIALSMGANLIHYVFNQ